MRYCFGYESLQRFSKVMGIMIFLPASVQIGKYSGSLIYSYISYEICTLGLDWDSK